MASKLQTQGLKPLLWKFRALLDVNLSIQPRMITAIIGPSGCGKSTLLRCFNRMNDLVKGVRVAGGCFSTERTFSACHEPVAAASAGRHGFPATESFPLSIIDNVTYGLRVHGETRRSRLLPVVESSLQATGLWDS